LLIVFVSIKVIFVEFMFVSNGFFILGTENCTLRL